MSSISILSGGAAQGLVKALEPAFSASSGFGIEGTFGAVGAMRAKLDAGHPTDLVILTAAILAELAQGGTVIADTVTDIGLVETAVAIRTGDPIPGVSNTDELRAALLAADAIYFPDPKLATAGIHFAGVLEELGIATAVESRLRTFPNGATAMAALAKAPEARPIGCTQVTEIKATAGVELVAALPKGLDLATPYTAGIVADSAHEAAARELLALLTAPSTQAERQRCGFL